MTIIFYSVLYYEALSEHSNNGPLELYVVLVRLTKEVIDSLRPPRTAYEIITNLHLSENSNVIDILAM